MKHMREPESLADVVRRAMTRHGVESGRALSEKSASLGSFISHTTINQIAEGTYRRTPSAATRDRLAKLAGVRRELVDQLARVPTSTPFVLPESADTLTGEQREAVLAVIRAFASANYRSFEEREAETEALADLVQARLRRVEDRFVPHEEAAYDNPQPMADPEDDDDHIA